MKKKLLLAGTLFALLSVIAGAFGSHALKKFLLPEDLTAYETAVRYQMYHALAILFTGLFLDESVPARAGKFSARAGIFFTSGIIFFSGSLYMITFFKVMNNSVPFLIGIATPLGGIMFACGWTMLAFSIFKK